MNLTSTQTVRRTRRWYPAAVLIAGLALTFLGSYFAARTVQLRNRAEFRSTVQHAGAEMERSLETYMTLLRGLAGYFAAHTNVTAQNFARYVDRLDVPRNYPGIQGIGFSLKVPPGGRESLREWMQSQGRANFRIWPDTLREEYHAILFLEPRNERNEAAIGFDMFSEPVRRRAMERARDSGMRWASEKVTLVQEIEGPKQPGFLIYTPVYHGGRIPPSVEERRERLHGFVYGPFRIGDLFQSVLGSPVLSAMNIRIHDVSSGAGNTVLFESFASRSGSSRWFTTVRRDEFTLDVAGRTWQIVMSSPPSRMSGWWVAPVVLLFGVAISSMLYSLTWSEADARRKVEENAARLRASEEAVRDREAQLRLIIESARDYAIFTLDLEGRITSWNKGAEKIFGYSEAEALGKSGVVIFTEEDRAAGASVAELNAARSQGISTDDRWHVRKDGTRVFVSGVVRPMNDGSGQPTGFLKVARDVTERLEAQARLQSEKDFSDTIINSLPGIFYMFEQSGRWLRWNENLEAITGYFGRDLIERHPVEFFVAEQQETVKTAISRVVELGHSSVEAELLTREGRRIPFLFYGRRILINNTACVMGMGVDISERKRIENELRAAEERLRSYAAELEQRVNDRTAHLHQSLQSLEDLLYHVAHDLRAPLRSMASFTKILMEDYAAQLDERANDYARRIANSAQFMDHLVQDILAYGHLAHSEVSVSPVNLERQVDDVLEQMSNEIQSLHAQIEVHRPLPAVKASPTIVSQIILNLVENALKFVPPERTPVVRIRAERNQAVRLWVEDNGIGIRPEYHHRIFRVFERLHGGDQFPGTGIGLAIVAKAAERLGGSVGLESTPGEGSRFWVELPSVDAKIPGSSGREGARS